MNGESERESESESESEPEREKESESGGEGKRGVRWRVGAGGRWAGEATRRGIFDRGFHGERGCGGPERGATGDERGGAVGLLALAATRAGDESDCDGPPRRCGVAAEVGG